jgi:hypothetical protein
MVLDDGLQQARSIVKRYLIAALEGQVERGDRHRMLEHPYLDRDGVDEQTDDTASQINCHLVTPYD